MRHAALTLVTALTLGTPVLRAAPAKDAKDRQGDPLYAIQAAYAAVDAATEHKNAAGATAYDTPDFASADVHGKVTDAAQGRQAATQLFAQAQSVSARTVILSLTLSAPGHATVLERGHLVTTLATTAQTGGPVKVVLDATARDLWVKTALGWRIRHEQALAETLTMNGKPLPAP